MMFNVFQSEFHPLLILRSRMSSTYIYTHEQCKTLRLVVVAFHMVDHNMLPDALESQVGHFGIELDWVEP